jgi:23S rRNA U2552 (ribose-2'-O)-methylase RlmE/FtsJ
MNNYNLNKTECSINSFHLAEGPGGFIEAMVNERKNPEDNYYGFTLMEKHNDVPKWKKIQDFLKSNKNIHLVYGPKGDGNLYFKHNLHYFRQHYKNQFDLVTADGGFDYSMDFNNQEQDSLNLIFCEVLYALIIQKEHGNFVLKMFDTFHINSVQILYLLSYFYKEVHIYKPKTSREANSEKYIICKDFCDVQNGNEIIDKLCEGFDQIIDHQISNLFNFDINTYFISKIEEINAIYGQQQIENILLTLNYIQEDLCENKDKIDKIKQSNIKKCIQWCNMHSQVIHPHLQTLNVD